jgi:putative endonuclease
MGECCFMSCHDPVTLLAQRALWGHTRRLSLAVVCADNSCPPPEQPSAHTAGEDAHIGDNPGAAAPPPKDPRHALGRLGEQLAAAHLERLGFAILARNARTRYGEIDVIAFDGQTLVFAEVKTRRARRRWRLSAEEQPLAWLRTSQRARLRRLAAAWLHRESRNRPTAHTIRFDGIGVIVDEANRLVCLDHIEGAW